MSDVEASLQRAQAALDLRRYKDAANEARTAIAVAPANWAGYALLAQALIALEQAAAAEQAVVAGLAQDPQNEWLHRLHALALLKRGRKQEALRASDEAVKLAPYIFNTHVMRSEVLTALGRMDEAFVACSHAHELAPHDAGVKGALGDLCLQMNDALRAEQYYRESLAIEPCNAGTLNNLGVVLKNQKKMHEAALAFKSAIMADPTLKAAKKNTIMTIDQMMKISGWGMFAWAMLQLFRLVDNNQSGWRLILALIVLAVIGYQWWQVKERKRGLETADPQLIKIYEQLKSDKKAGWF